MSHIYNQDQQQRDVRQAFTFMCGAFFGAALAVAVIIGGYLAN